MPAYSRWGDRMSHGKSACGRFCSLIPGLGVKLSTIILAGPTVLSAVGACPPHDGVRRRWRTNVASAVVLLDARKNRTISPPPPSRQGRLFPPCRGIPVISLCVLRGSLLRRPVELRSVDPHAVQNNRELARDGDFGLARERIASGTDGSGPVSCGRVSESSCSLSSAAPSFSTAIPGAVCGAGNGP